MIKFILIIVLSSCTILSQETPHNKIITTQSIFLDIPSKNVYLTMDNIVPSLKISTVKNIQNYNLNITTKDRAGIILTVKTKFYGKIATREFDKVLKKDLDISHINSVPTNTPYEKQHEKTTIDKLIADPSGLIIGFAIGSAMSNPIVGAPIGMAMGVWLNMAGNSLFERTIPLTVLEIEVHEKAQSPIWYKDKRIHKQDEYSSRTYEYSEQTRWKTYKTRIIVYGEHSSEKIAQRIVSLII